MFTTFFKMTSQPFTERVDTNRIIKDNRFENYIAKLQYMLYHGDIALIYGPAGAGKTTLIKLFLANIPQNQYLPLYINFTHLKTSSLLNLVVSQLGEPLKHTKDRLFLQIKEKIKKLNLTVLLIIDEAHLLETETITDLRLLISPTIEETSTLKIVLSGQDAVRENLRRSCLNDFAQRICVRCKIIPLTKEECFLYVDLQMKYAQVSENIFQQEAKELIFEYSSGIPRQINNIATASLINASAQNLQFINNDIVMQSIAELQSL